MEQNNLRPSQEILQIFQDLRDGVLEAEHFPSADTSAIIQAIIHFMDRDAERRKKE